jgi:hypothetical protein
MTAPIDDGNESILQEAHRLTHGNRNADYGHPLDDYTRTAALVSALFAHKLTEPLTADEMALAMVCVKLSRQAHKPKRDNMVDAAGYCWVAHACLEEAARRMAVAGEPVAYTPAVLPPPTPAPMAVEPCRDCTPERACRVHRAASGGTTHVCKGGKPAPGYSVECPTCQIR